jgi:hypothetical protein
MNPPPPPEEIKPTKKGQSPRRVGPDGTLKGLYHEMNIFLKIKLYQYFLYVL